MGRKGACVSREVKCKHLPCTGETDAVCQAKCGRIWDRRQWVLVVRKCQNLWCERPPTPPIEAGSPVGKNVSRRHPERVCNRASCSATRRDQVGQASAVTGRSQH